MTEIQSSPEDASPLEAARRDKLRKIIELGHDPWGSRFDQRSMIGDIRLRADEIVFRTEAGESVELPDLDSMALDEAVDDFNFRQWLADLGPGTMVGPQVRAAGRIVLHRDKGKLKFIDIRDMSGDIQLFIGKKQLGDDWELAQCVDLGDLIGVDGQLKRTKTGELSIFVERLHFLSKSLKDLGAGKRT